MRILSMLLLPGSIVAICGCVALSEQQLESREYRRVDFEEEFKYARSQCLSRGGRMFIDAKRTLGRDGIPKRGDRYFCS